MKNVLIAVSLILVAASAAPAKADEFDVDAAKQYCASLVPSLALQAICVQNERDGYKKLNEETSPAKSAKTGVLCADINAEMELLGPRVGEAFAAHAFAQKGFRNPALMTRRLIAYCRTNPGASGEASENAVMQIVAHDFLGD